MKRNNILLYLSEQKEADAIKESLGNSYNLCIQNSIHIQDFFYDLLIIDYVGISKEFETMRSLKVKDNLVPPPILLIISPQELEEGARYFDYIDEIIFTPIKKIVFLFRIKNLLNRFSFTRTLKQKTYEQETFMKALFHDIRNPLNHILNFSHLMKKEIKPIAGSTIDNYFMRMSTSIQKITNLTDSLSSFFKMENKKIELTRISLINIFELIQNELKEDIKKYEGRISTDLKVDELFTEISLFKIVIGNLILNSLKFRKKESPPFIKISSYSKNNTIIVEIKDNGIGFNHQHVERIGMPFERLYPREGDKGMGLGLYTVKRILTILMGTLEVESTYGEGTTCIIKFPCPSE